jgi:hypothetical protein
MSTSVGDDCYVSLSDTTIGASVHRIAQKLKLEERQ